jgi:endoglucanase
VKYRLVHFKRRETGTKVIPKMTRLLSIFLTAASAVCGLLILSPAAAFAQDVTLHGRLFYKDGHPWRAKGIDTETFITCAQHTTGKYTALRTYWDAAKLDQLRAEFHIDTLRIYVSQIGLDPTSGVCGADYREEIVSAAKLALSKGLVVILQLDWQTPTGEDKPLKDLLGLPDEHTVRAWRNLAPAFAHDRRVMYELFVEPKLHWSEENLALWTRGIQPVIDAVRATGAENIILLDGLDYGRITRGMPGRFHDPLPDRWGFAVDTQFTAAFKSPKDWDQAFGQVAEKYPTIMAGFTYNNWSGCLPGAAPEQLVTEHFNYLKSKNIGIVLWGDYPETLWHGYDPSNLTSYKDFTGCQDHSYTGPRGGPGEVFARYQP